MNKSFLKDFQGKKIQNESGVDIGILSGMLLDIEHHKIIGCIYKKGFLQYRYFLFDDILKEENNIYIISEKEQKQEFYEIDGKQVKNENGKNIGYVDDIEINLVNKLQYIYINNGYNLSFDRKNILKRNIIKISQKAILAYEKDCVVIQEKQTIKENKKTLENIRKVFINIPEPNYNLNFNKYE
ncbi:MAG: PRC-barrel domain-containing protein [Candidatus Altimarinota bacterium]